MLGLPRRHMCRRAQAAHAPLATKIWESKARRAFSPGLLALDLASQHPRLLYHTAPAALRGNQPMSFSDITGPCRGCMQLLPVAAVF
jgi:hypothetical protein